MTIVLSGRDLPGSVMPEFLKALQAAVGDFVLVGAVARDLHVVCRAGIQEPRSTQDVDITVFARSYRDLREQMASLEESGSQHVFFLHGVQVDVLAQGPIAPGGVLDVSDGVTCDVTGMADAARGAEELTIADDVTVSVPSLAGLVGLKLVAWDVREAFTKKDAQDLVALLDASHRGDFDERCWQASPQAERHGYVPDLVGPALLGAELERDWDDATVERLIRVLDEQRERLVGDCLRYARANQPVAAQLDALRDELG